MAIRASTIGEACSGIRIDLFLEERDVIEVRVAIRGKNSECLVSKGIRGV